MTPENVARMLAKLIQGLLVSSVFVPAHEIGAMITRGDSSLLMIIRIIPLDIRDGILRGCFTGRR